MKKNEKKKELKVQAIDQGTVIDHIPSQQTMKVVEILSAMDDFVTIGINFPSKTMKLKGVVKIANRMLTENEVNKIAVFAPGASVNIIENYKVVRKTQVHIPECIIGILKCSNPKCVTNSDEDVVTKFYLKTQVPLSVMCHYCERHQNEESLVLL